MITYEEFKKHWKRYIFSSALTFLAGFAMAMGDQWSHITLESLKTGSIWGLVFVGVRGGIKLLLEAFLVFYRK